MENVASVLDTPAQIRLYHLSAQRAALKLELAGLKHSSGKSMYAHLKRVYGWRGSRQRVYNLFCEYIEKEKAIG